MIEPAGAPDPRRVRRRRRRTLLVISVLVLVFALTTVYEVTVLSQRSLLILVAVNFNVALLLLLLMLLFRNITKLVFERRRQPLGSKLRTRLILTFIGLAVVPSIALFITAGNLISVSLDRWFNPRVDSFIEATMEILGEESEARMEGLLHFARQLGERLVQKEGARGRLPGDLQPWLAEWLRDLQLSAIHLYDASGELIASARDPRLPAGVAAPPGEVLAAALRGEEGASSARAAGGELIAAAIPLRGPVLPGGALVVSRVLDRRLERRLAHLRAEYAAYRERKASHFETRTFYLSILSLITLTLIFSATWLGFYIARGITEPIEKLADATHKVAAGRFDLDLPAEGYAEIGVLIRAFNKMTRDLGAAQAELARANEELRAKNRELEERRTEIEAVLQNITTGVITLDAENKVSALNTAAARMLHLQAEEALQRPIDEVLGAAPLGPLREFLQTALAGGASRHRRILELGFESQTSTLAASVSFFAEHLGRSPSALIILEDLTQLIKSQRMAAWQEVARRIAHEVKNPLTPIRLNAERLKRRLRERAGDDEERGRLAELTQTIIDEVDSMKALVNEFTQFARMPEVNLQPTDLASVIQQAVAIYAAMGDRVRIHFLPGPELPPMRLDAEQLKRTLVNLIDNALDAMGGRGEIRIEIELLPQARVVAVHVDDEGPGIAPRDRHRIFSPYFSRKPRGSGLGLAIVQRIVADHGGYVRARNRSPRGARFTIELPLDLALAPK
jgi:two-component system nitrogen regulation sensor histidine kinase NtrY